MIFTLTIETFQYSLFRAVFAMMTFLIAVTTWFSAISDMVTFLFAVEAFHWFKRFWTGPSSMSFFTTVEACHRFSGLWAIFVSVASLFTVCTWLLRLSAIPAVVTVLFTIKTLFD